MKINIVFLLLFLFTMSACHTSLEEPLPILGPKKMVAGQKQFHPVPPFQLVDHRNIIFTDDSCKNKIRIVDFFFTACPTICPKVQQQLIRIYQHFPAEQQLLFLSHSFDTKRDTVGRLKEYARQLELSNSPQWHFLTGEKDHLYELATNYFNVIIDDETAPGGFNHTGRIVLVDPKGYIRSFVDGTDPIAVDTFIQHIQILLDEYE